MATPNPPRTPRHIGAIPQFEPFVARHIERGEEYPSMLIGTDRMLIISKDGEPSAFGIGITAQQRTWEFVRYLGGDESIAFRGAGTGQPVDGAESLRDAVAAALKEPAKPFIMADLEAMVDLPHPEIMRKTRRAGDIPDGVYYRIRSGSGPGYDCVNCPPRRGHSKRLDRSITLVGGGGDYVQDTGLDLLSSPGWDFVSYVLPKDINKKLLQYPLLRDR